MRLSTMGVVPGAYSLLGGSHGSLFLLSLSAASKTRAARSGR